MRFFMFPIYLIPGKASTSATFSAVMPMLPEYRPLQVFWQVLNISTQDGTHFGTTTSFGIAPIGGQAANVMELPRALTGESGYLALCGASPNGGGGNVNQYTVFPSGAGSRCSTMRKPIPNPATLRGCSSRTKRPPPA
jgi:hypothetical protein